jgi:hypothetical protein
VDDIIIELPDLSMERGTWSSPPQLSCSVRQHFGSQVEHGVWASKLSELTTLNPSQITKSGIMVGLDETFDKVVETNKEDEGGFEANPGQLRFEDWGVKYN